MRKDIKEGDFVYLHEVDHIDIREGIREGIYKVAHSDGDSIRVFVNNTNDRHFLYSYQVHKVVSNKINKLLYKGLS